MHGKDGIIVWSFNIIGALYPFLTRLLLETLQVLFLPGCRPRTVKGFNQLAHFTRLILAVKPSARYARVEDIKHSVDDVGNEVYVALPSSSSSIHAE